MFVGYYEILYNEYTINRLYQFTASVRKSFIAWVECFCWTIIVNILFTSMKFNISVLWIVIMMTKKKNQDYSEVKDSAMWNLCLHALLYCKSWTCIILLCTVVQINTDWVFPCHFHIIFPDIKRHGSNSF